MGMFSFISSEFAFAQHNAPHIKANKLIFRVYMKFSPRGVHFPNFDKLAWFHRIVLTLSSAVINKRASNYCFISA